MRLVQIVKKGNAKADVEEKFLATSTLWKAAQGMSDEARPVPRAKTNASPKRTARAPSYWTDRVFLTEHGTEVRNDEVGTEIHFGCYSETVEVPPPLC